MCSHLFSSLGRPLKNLNHAWRMMRMVWSQKVADGQCVSSTLAWFQISTYSTFWLNWYVILPNIQHSCNIYGWQVSKEIAIPRDKDDTGYQRHSKACQPHQIGEPLPWWRQLMGGFAPHRGVPSHPHPHLIIGENFFPSPSPSGSGRRSVPH
jgi:hypothetical protein